MDTIEPEYISKNRGIYQKYVKGSNILDDTILQEVELNRSEWFISVLEKDSISNKKELEIQIFKELDIYGYAYIGKFKIHKYLYKLLYWLKLIKI